jgi:hypothetical protein
MKETQATLIVILVLAVIAGGTWWFFSSNGTTGTQNGPAVGESVSVEKRFPTKLVYTQDTEQDPTPYRNHCAQQGGTFNECGTICAPDAGMCAQVCAYTCDLSQAGTGTSFNTPWGSPNGWDTYANPDLGFSVNYPSDRATVTEAYNDVDDRSVISIEYTGDDQPEQTDLQDGFSVSFQREQYTADSLRSYVEREYNALQDAAGSTTSSISERTINQRTGYEFTGGVMRPSEQHQLYIPMSSNVALHISHTSADPNEIGYKAIVEGILSTVQVFTKL